MKIKLILCAHKNDPMKKNDPFMPLSLAILAGAAPKHEYSVVDMLWEEKIDFDEEVDLVGISTRFTGEKTAYEIADEYRRRGVKVVLGGPQISSVPMKAIEHADAVSVGEGELTWPRLVADAEKGELKDFYVSSPEPFVAEGYTVDQIDHYPDFRNFIKPDRTLFKKKYVFDTVFATRGCPIGCDFCSVSSIFGTSYRQKPIDHVIREIESFKNYYYLLDDVVFGRPSTYDYYLELYERISKLKKKRYWTGQINIDAASHPKGREVIKMAAKSGLLYAAAGLESIDPRILKESGAYSKMGIKDKEDPLKSMKENIRFIQEQGIAISGWFVIGYDGDTIESYKATAEFCEEMNIFPVIFPVSAMPGTKLYDKALAQGRLDTSRTINYVNKDIDENEVYNVLESIIKRGYNFRKNLQRARFYSRFFKDKNFGDKIHKFIFIFMTQKNLKPGIDASRKEFYCRE
jgi:radical SAM superfamily enzyme YgiQ (UPF0313 family)